MKTVALAVVTVLAVACVPKVSQPEVRLDGVRLASLGFSGGVVDVRLSVYNPNSFGLRARGLTYDLDLQDPNDDGWFDFTEGRLDRDLRIEPGDTLEVVVPVDFEYRELGRALRALIDRGRFDYRVSGEVALEAPVRREFRYRHGGAVSPDDVR